MPASWIPSPIITPHMGIGLDARVAGFDGRLDVAAVEAAVSEEALVPDVLVVEAVSVKALVPETLVVAAARERVLVSEGTVVSAANVVSSTDLFHHTF
jgi:hypothetical protein